MLQYENNVNLNTGWYESLSCNSFSTSLQNVVTSLLGQTHYMLVTVVNILTLA